MRRPLVTAALTVALLLSTACTPDNTGAGSGASAGPSADVSAAPSGSAGSSGAAAPGGSGVPAPDGSGPAAGNAKQVCAQVIKDSSAAVTDYVNELTKMAQAGDTAAGREAQKAAEQALDRWVTSLKAQAKAATDARLATVLTQLADEVSTMTADINALGGPKVEEFQQRLDQLCGTG